MNKDLFTLRENEIFQTLTEIRKCNFVVIGGYAVNAYTLPRFSVDCDIVVKDENELKKIEDILLKIGYKKETLQAEIPYSGNFARFEKSLENNFKVSMDILIDTVTDRMTKAAFSAGWIFENSTKIILKGKTIKGELLLKIIDLDALLVMKIISCRSTDIRDVFMLIPYAVNTKWIKREIALRYDFQDRITKIAEKVSSVQFKDGLAGVFGYFDVKIFEKHKKLIIGLL